MMVLTERAPAASARCRCRGHLRFTTDLLGRTVEVCENCHYSGVVRVVCTLKEPTLPRRVHRRRPQDFAAFRCGHLRTPDNCYRHPRGYSQCRQCGRHKARKFGRAVA